MCASSRPSRRKAPTPGTSRGARERFLGKRANEGWQKVDDILDVWFDSGSTHAFVLEDPKHFPALAGIKRKADGGADAVMYLEGSDQHRGWFQSSLLESCGTRGRAPFDVVLTHGFVLDEDGRKMSKSLGNVTAPQDVIKQSGADILRMWVCAADYADDLRIGAGNPEDHRRHLSQAAQHDALDARQSGAFPRRRARRARADAGTRAADAASACRARRARPPGLCGFRLQAHLRRAQRVHDGRSLGVLFRYPQGRALLRSDLLADAQGVPDGARPSVPLHGDLARADAVLHRGGGLARARSGRRPRCIWSRSRTCRPSWRDDALAEKWRKVRNVRRVVTGALEIERARKAHRLVARGRIRSSMSPIRTCSPRSSTSISPKSASPRRRRWSKARGRPRRSGLPDVPGVAVVSNLAEGRKCARSWKISPAVGADPQFPDVTPRDAQALREWEAMRKAAE